MTVKADWSPVAQNEDEHESFEEHALDEMDCDSDRLLQEHAYASGRRKRSTHSLSNNAFCLVCNRLFAFVKGRHILSCFTMFVAVSFAYLVVYSFHGEENAVDSVWQGVTGIQYKSLAEWRDEEGGAASSWNCSSTGEGLDAERTRICEYRNFCVDVDRGGFLIQKSNSTHQELPTVNIMASPKERDVYWSAQVFSAPPTTHYGYIDDTVFIYGLDEGEGANLTEGWRSSNAIYEGLLPLWSIMQQYGATSNSWLFRPDPITTIAKKDIRPAPAVDMSYIFPHGREIVLNEDSITTRFQILAPKSTVPMCFARAIVGLGNRCGHDYCSKKISASDVTSLKQQIKGAFAADLEQKETQELAAETGMEFNFLPNVTIVNYSYESRVENLKDLERPLREAGFNVRKIELPDGSLLSVLDAVYAFAHSEIIIAPQSPILAQAALFAPEMSTLISISNQQAQPAVSALQTPIRLSGHRTYDSICTASNCTVVSEPVMDKCFEASLLQSYRNDAAYSNAIDMLKLRKTLDQIIAENRAALPAIARPARMQQISDAYGCYTQLAPRHANVSEILKVVSQAALDMGYVMRLVDTGDATDTRPQQLYDAGLDMRTRAAGMAGICRAGRCCGPRVSLPLAIAETMTDCVDDEWGSLTEIQDDLLRSLTTLEEKYAQQEKREIVPIYSAEQSDAKDAKASQRERTIITHAISGEDSTTLLKRKRDDEHVETTNIQDTRANKQHETIKLSTHVTQASPSIKNERTSSFAVTTQYRSPLRAMDMNRNDHQQPTTFPSLKSPLGSLKLSRIQARQVTPSKHFVAPRSVVNTKAEQQIPTRPEREREKKQFTVYQSTQPPPSPSPQPHILEQQVDTSQLGEESQSETRLGEVVHDRQASPQRGATISLPEVRTPFQDDPGTPSERCSQELPITFDEFDDDVADLGDILESSIDAIESTSALMTCAAALPQRSTSSSLQSSINLGLQDIENLTATYGGFKTGHNKTLTVKVSSTHVAAFSSQGSSQDGCVNPGTPTNLKQLAARALHGGQ
ncbi:hypothetical protein BZG36_02197 [Bifiguratus adelaidae]|uniref:Uncharacterized protein n=1 Tax=Bifiguratus adelaidae TaxID=1938954 RepID=A0A261Y3J4_9FUNG|nr:hypothetical protein BZG36_02197 [Bifiguratus adelaidae]